MCMGEFFDLGHGVPTWRPLRPRISKNPKPKNFDQKRDENGLAMGNGPRNLRNLHWTGRDRDEWPGAMC